MGCNMAQMGLQFLINNNPQLTFRPQSIIFGCGFFRTNYQRNKFTSAMQSVILSVKLFRTFTNKVSSN